MPPSFLSVRGLVRDPTEFEGIFSVICWGNDLMKNPLVNSFEIWRNCWKLVGVDKKDGSVNLISFEIDIRPIVLGLTWRKIIFKTTFSFDRFHT